MYAHFTHADPSYEKAALYWTYGMWAFIGITAVLGILGLVMTARHRSGDG
jgi:hypothetical protein